MRLLQKIGVALFGTQDVVELRKQVAALNRDYEAYVRRQGEGVLTLTKQLADERAAHEKTGADLRDAVATGKRLADDLRVSRECNAKNESGWAREIEHHARTGQALREADATADGLRAEIRTLGEALEKAQAGLRVAEAENAGLWKLADRYRTFREREIAMEARAIAEAESAANAARADMGGDE